MTSLRHGQARPAVSAPRPFWESGYAAVLAVVDAFAVTLACALAYRLRFGHTGAAFAAEFRGDIVTVPYSAFLAMIAPLWVGVLAMNRAYEARLLGVGAEEFKRVLNASVRFVAVLAFVAFATKSQVARGFVAIVVPLGLILLLAGRYAGREVLHRMRRGGRCLHRVVAVGSPVEVTDLALQVLREPSAGFHVVAVALPVSSPSTVTIAGEVLLNIGPASDLVGRLLSVNADTVAVAGTSAMSARELRQLSWDLEGTGMDLVVNPVITDVTGPRIHIRPVAGLPLLQVESPTFDGLPRIVKRVVDIVVALVLLALCVLPFLVIAPMIKSGGGPIFYRQVRAGQKQELFRIWKLRTMTVDAERDLAGLLASNESDGPLFKMANDPRVTRLGATLRRFSLDELPQLFNVLGGSMSLVGPRPPLPTEVDVYEHHVHRRLLVKPGMTGLWQVSGRADLTWEESVRLDLYYVENWSVALDVQILWKTGFAVLARRGAY